MTASVPPPTPLRAATHELRNHQEWLGFVQPVGLVVSLPALDKAQCWVSSNVGHEQQVLRALASSSAPARIPHFRALANDVLGWEEGDLAEAPESLFVPLPEYGDVMRPTWAVPNGEDGYQILVVEIPPAMPF